MSRLPTLLLSFLLATVTTAAPFLSQRQFDYQSAALEAHNVHRANHSASALTWDSSLQASAEALAEQCIFQHNTQIDGGGYGQNLAVGNPDTAISKSISDQWYNNEIGYYTNYYGQAQPPMTYFEDWGHFSQLVWLGTTSVGCATQYCDGGVQGFTASPWITVCNYGPPGNWQGEYGANVMPPLDQAPSYGTNS